ncbi:Heat shock protein binding protein putative isoform 1 [Tripterygium wilfordii]|uniref:Heat shock protein binding protein putative isoform 1 n=1 Tax=Tripterygium wilfordii TaxID=458696 RepID=A0A7J7DAT0_TRIWF|nr:uncharacterized protein LOC120004229 [Tripterygium wilfordii]XP_038709429.1 uncharacterized protein LOC120004229 [Tripterygium wilfordii]XP_038709430.1 uncharacterized protein LOC120004229 [Tripterygium wilfordii]KAF5743467.1 Heat shock protein binding protein putative isoform 1 [Tripterygium wilfordii]
MECNKDEALRAKDIAEGKFMEKNYSGAKKFALKAQNLYSGLEGLSHMLTVLDVHISAEKRICGEVDWYAVLGVTPWANDETIRKQYRKLALLLHPDKNKSVGADGAFKLVSEAWSLLSDETKRAAYNLKLTPKIFQTTVPTQSGVPSAPSAPPRANGVHKFTGGATSQRKTHNNNTRAGPTSAPAPRKRTDTFWTMCNRCRTQYEYLRIYLNHTLLCPSCNKAFFATEKDPPPNVNKSANSSPHQQHQNLRNHPTNSNRFNVGRNSDAAQNVGPGEWGPFSRMAGVGGFSASPSTAAQAASVVQQAHEKLKHEEAQAAAESERCHVSKRMTDSAVSTERPSKNWREDNYGGDMRNQTGMGFGVGSATRSGFEAQSTHGFSGIGNKHYSERELSLIEQRKILVGKALNVIHGKVQQWSLETEVKAAAKEKERAKEKNNKKQKGVLNGDVHDVKQPAVTNDGYQKSLHGSSVEASEEQAPISIVVPDPDFHNFDSDRTESSFDEDQIWAAYDDNDGMPRYYVRIRKVISLKPFRMQISFLNSKSNSEFGQLEWVGSGFPKTCGVFRMGKLEISETLNSFSHKVSWEKGTRGTINIYPTKGDIWALYRNWSPDWNEHTPDEVVHKYEMVEVLNVYGEEQGVSVAPLVKVPGFKTVFQKHMDPKEVRQIPKEEMFRFSHQVPNYLLTGKEANNAPKGYWELDPAATPLELLQVITETGGAPLGETDGENEKVVIDNGTS